MAAVLWGGCKTSSDEPRPVQAGVVDDGVQLTPAPLTLTEVADSPAEAPAFERRKPDETSELTGYDEGGALTCLPLAAASECLARTDPLEAACKAAGGEVVRCEDCSLLCTRPLSPDNN